MPRPSIDEPNCNPSHLSDGPVRVSVAVVVVLLSNNVAVIPDSRLTGPVVLDCAFAPRQARNNAETSNNFFIAIFLKGL
jgi:hypothetical protein